MTAIAQRTDVIEWYARRGYRDTDERHQRELGGKRVACRTNEEIEESS
jgi:hypothetical protein